MSSAQVKKQLHDYIDQVDDRILHAMYAMLQNYLQQEEAIVGFTVQGQPLTKKDMIDSLNEAVSDVEKGKGISSDDIRKQKKNW